MFQKLQSPESARREYLDELYNKYGSFEVMIANTNEFGEKSWSRWRDWLDVRENSFWVEKINNRTIMQPEVVLDIEDPADYDFVLGKLLNRNFKFRAFTTGSRGYHIHLIFSQVLALGEKQRSLTKRQLIEFFTVPGLNMSLDLQKNSNRCPIALEHAPHWKTGNPKQLVMEKEGLNQLPPSMWEEIREYSKIHEKVTTLKLLSQKS